MTIQFTVTRITKSEMNDIFANESHFVLRNSNLTVEFVRRGEKHWEITTNGKSDIFTMKTAMMQFDSLRGETQFFSVEEDDF